MSRKKTKRGVEMRNTVGMKTDQSEKTWVVVADRSQGKIFEWQSKRLELTEKKTWKSLAGRKKGRELVSDRPGRVFNSMTFAKGGHQTAAPRHSYSSEDDPAKHEALMFAKTIADWLEKHCETARDVEFVIIAEPHFMGYLTERLSKTSRTRIKKKLQRDFHWVEENEIRDRVIRWLSGKERNVERLLPRRIGAFGYNKSAVSRHGR